MRFNSWGEREMKSERIARFTAIILGLLLAGFLAYEGCVRSPFLDLIH
jgi:hypothetical protein